MDSRLINRVVVAQQRVRDAEAKAAEARVALADAIEKANAGGFSLDLIGKTLGVSRQRVAQLKQHR